MMNITIIINDRERLVVEPDGCIVWYIDDEPTDVLSVEQAEAYRTAFEQAVTVALEMKMKREEGKGMRTHHFKIAIFEDCVVVGDDPIQELDDLIVDALAKNGLYNRLNCTIEYAGSTDEPMEQSE